ncbi:MAG TPA: TetR/AcrR family transcriptional regulator [Phycisphaerales bacterium]|nr:TetR/AcrR family transcriptional regulator [Phycisphaerales bacterium]
MMSQNQNKESKKSGDNVRKRLLDTAEKLFSEKGFASTSIRDITREGCCNIAAVNYYFGGKDNLYLQVFRRQLDKMKKIRIKSIRDAMDNSTGPANLKKLVHSFAQVFVESLLAEEGNPQFINLVIREMLDPQLPQEMFAADYIQPIAGAFKDALCKLCPQLDPISAELCIHSLVGQLYQVVRATNLYRKIRQDNNPVLDVPRVIDHIVCFSVAGIRACIEEGQLNEKA